MLRAWHGFMRVYAASFTLLMIACAGATEPNQGDGRGAQDETSAESSKNKDSNFGAGIPDYSEPPNVDHGSTSSDGYGSQSLSAGKPHWDPCSDDSECQSDWCGCAYGEKPVCLPSKQFPKVCQTLQPPKHEGPAGAGTTCTSNDECASKTCGCYLGPQKECLPGPGWVQPCGTGGAVGHACNSNADCATGACGCFGSTTKKCLPDASWIKDCAAPK